MEKLVRVIKLQPGEAVVILAEDKQEGFLHHGKGLS